MSLNGASLVVYEYRRGPASAPSPSTCGRSSPSDPRRSRIAGRCSFSKREYAPRFECGICSDHLRDDTCRPLLRSSKHLPIEGKPYARDQLQECKPRKYEVLNMCLQFCYSNSGSLCFTLIGSGSLFSKLVGKTSRSALLTCVVLAAGSLVAARGYAEP